MVDVYKNLEKYLGTKTLIIVECQKHWDQIIPFLRIDCDVKFDESDYITRYKCAINLEYKFQETYAELNWYKITYANKYKNYTFISSNIICNKNEIYECW